MNSRHRRDGRHGSAFAEAVKSVRAGQRHEIPCLLADEYPPRLEHAAASGLSLNVRVPFSAAARALRNDVGASEDSVAELDGVSAVMARVKHDILKVARDAYVSALILGESGTGKERVARAIHRLSMRAGRPFVVVNCAGLPPTLAEDALFGHVRGAFTGAINPVAGPFERADGGTVFLDEIGDLTHELQVKLLRALQQRTVLRLGATLETSFDVRVVAATNVDLMLAVQQGRFREDLYYRLNVYELYVPPLRSRGMPDLQRLVPALLDQISARRGRPAPSLVPGVWESFARYAWPGNIRELENTLERMTVAAAGQMQLTPAHLPDNFGGPGRQGAADRAATHTVSRIMPTPAEASAALVRNHFKRGRAASELGISRHQLYRLLKQRAGVVVAADHALG
jgi:transcriptional regulator with PAS, ATPase and Fis domain